MKKVYELSNDGAQAYYSSSTKIAKEIHGILSRAVTHYEEPKILLYDGQGKNVLTLGSMDNLTIRDIAFSIRNTGDFRSRIGSRIVCASELEVH